MLTRTYRQGVITAGILSLGLLLGLTIFVNAAESSKPDCVLCGHITDLATGQAVTDAIVRISGGPISQIETDANGFYCFEKIDEDRDYRVGIDSNEYVGIYDYDKMPAVNLKKDNHIIRDFKLGRACMFKVQVVDEANQPVENAEISVSYPDDYRSRRIGSDMLRRKTDKEGFYLIGGIPLRMNILITATHGIRVLIERKDGQKYGQNQWDYAPGHLEVTLNDPEVTESGKIVLQKGVDVNGIAKYQDGVPASDLKIEAYPEWWGGYNSPQSYPIDANGNFTLRYIVPENYRLMAFIPRGTGGSVGIPVSKITLPLPGNEILKVTIPQKSPQSLVSIKGKLTFSGDKIPNYVHIEAYSPNGGHHFADWQNIIRGVPADTNFVIDRLEPGKYRLTFSGQDIEQKVLENVVAPTDELIVEIGTPQKVVLKGTVINAQTGQPIQNFKARARKTKILSGDSRQQSDKWIDFNDSRGRFSFEATGADVYQVQIATDGFAWTWSGNVNPDQNDSAEIKLLPGGGIKGRVVNESGKSVKGAKVLPLSMAGGMWIMLSSIQDPFITEDGEVQTGDDGVFELKHLTPGRESIKVIYPDYPYFRMDDIEVKEGQTTENIKVVMSAGGIVEGYVYDTQSQAMPGITLNFRDVFSDPDEKKGRFASVITDEKGYYRAAGLPEQLLIVERPRTGDSMGVVSRAMVPTNGRVSRIDFGGKPIVTGRIILNGAPLANRRIVLSSTESAHSDAFRCFAMTAPDGKFTFGGVPTGKWQIYYEDPEKQGEWIKITGVDVTGKDNDLGDVAVKLFTINAALEYEPGEPKWDIVSSTIQEAAKPWGMQTAKLTQQGGENGTFVVKNIPPGDYSLNFRRQDYLTLRQPVTVKENDINVAVHVPRCTSSVRGKITPLYKGGTVFWNKDKSIVAYLGFDANENYEVKNLPAGHYFACGNMMIEAGVFFEFDLADSHVKDLADINLPGDYLKNKQTGSLQVAVLDENGSPIPGTKVHLSGSSGAVEPIDFSSREAYFMAEPGTYTLQVSYTGYKTATQSVTIEKYDQKKAQTQRKPRFVRLEKE